MKHGILLNVLKLKRGHYENLLPKDGVLPVEKSSPLQNRVNPLGYPVATPERGGWMGNRGCLHDANGNIIRQWATRRWIFCRLDFKNRHREPMPPGKYTALFFLDEATALAAGHRPCAECQRERYNEFISYWGKANADLLDGQSPRADAVDRILHQERMVSRKEPLAFPVYRLESLPDGVIVADFPGLTPYLKWKGLLLPWSFAGYAQDSIIFQIPDANQLLLTPVSIMRAIQAGYQPQIHPSVLRDFITRNHA